MDRPEYRVVLTGDVKAGFSREAVIAALSRFFEVSAGELVRVFGNGGCPVGGAMDADQALGLQRRLEQMGARVRVDRLAEGAEVAVAVLSPPVHRELDAAGLMHCPACGHEQLVAESCDECGVLFSQFNRGTPASTGAPPVAKPAPAAKPARQSPYARRDVHKDVNDGWRDQWLDEGDSTPSEEFHLRLFMGTHSEHLIHACEKMTVGQRVLGRLSWTWGAVFSPFLWALYRKMWAWGLVIFVTEIFLPVLLIILGTKEGISDKLTYLGIALLIANRVFWPAALKSLYCRHSRNTIALLHRMSPTYASDIDIATRGGTSRTSAFVGIVMAIVTSMLTWSTVDSLYAAVYQGPALYSTPENLPPPPALPVPAGDKPPEIQTDLLANENKWVATRNKLRVLGQRVNAWLVDAGSSIDAAALDIGQIATSLSLDDDGLLDGWGNRIDYQSDGKGYKLISSGPDGAFGSSDDVEYRRILQRR